MAGKPGYKNGPMTQAHRDKIAKSNILNRLIKCASGEIEMDSVQGQVAIALMRKVLPDLASQDLTVTDATPFALIPEQMQDVTAWEDRYAPKPETEH